MGLTGWELDSRSKATISFTFWAITDQQYTLARQKEAQWPNVIDEQHSCTGPNVVDHQHSVVQWPNRDFMARISSLSSLKS